MNYYTQREEEACAKLAELLERPLAEERELQSCEDFDPWEITPGLYGTYSSDFDDMAIKVLENLELARQDRWNEQDWASEGLAHQMFREMLCNAGLCDYGTSPRVCFAATGFRPLLPRLLERWKEWREFQWGSPSDSDGSPEGEKPQALSA